MSSTAAVPVMLLALCCASVSQVYAGEADADFAAAADQYAARHWEQAAAGFRQFTEAHAESPQRGQAMLLAGEALVQQGKFAEGYSILVDLMAEQPAGPWAKQALFRASEAAIGCGKTDEAEIRMSQFQAKYPNDKLNANILIDRAKLALHHGDAATAGKFYRESLSRFGDLPTADECRLGLAEALQTEKQVEAADQLLHEVGQSKHSPFAEMALLQLATEQLNADHPQAALDLYATIEKQFPGSPLLAQVHLGCGQALFQMRRFAEAEAILTPLATNTLAGTEARKVLLLAQKAEVQEKQRQAAEQEQKRVAEEKERLRLALEERHRKDQDAQRQAEEEQQRKLAQQEQDRKQREAEHRSSLAAAANQAKPATPQAPDKITPPSPVAAPVASAETTKSTGSLSAVSSRRDPKAAVAKTPLVTVAPPSPVPAASIDPDPSPSAAAAPVADEPAVNKTGISRDEQDQRRAATIRFQAAEALIRAGDYSRAIATLQMGDNAGVDLRSLENRYLLAVVQQKAGHDADSLETLKQLSAALTAILAKYPTDAPDAADYAQIDAGAASTASHLSAQDVAALRALNLNVQLMRSTALVAKEKHAEAIEPLQVFLASAPHDPRAEQVRSALALCLVKTNRLEEAKQALAELRADFPASKLLISTAREVAEAAYDAEQYAVAADLFIMLTAEGNPPAAIAQGLAGFSWCRYQTGEYEAANSAMSQFLQRFPTDSGAAEMTLLRGQVLEKLKKDDEAAAIYRQALTRYPQAKQMPQLLLAAARLYDRLGKDDEAVPLYQRVIREYPKSPDVDAVLYDLAWSLRDLGRGNDSDKVFHKLCEEHPHSRFCADATYRLAERASSHAEHDVARGLLVPLLANSECPAEVREHALYLLGQLAIGEEKWAAAEPFLEQLIHDCPDGKLRLPSEFWLAELAFRGGDYEVAQQRFETLAPRISDHSEPWMAIVPLRRAQILAGQKQWAAARTMAETIAQDYPQFDRLFEADYVIGRALAAEDQFDDARAAFLRVVQSPTGSKTETAAMAQSKIADTYFQQENYSTALQEYLRIETVYQYPHWQAAALLQAARCDEQLGQQQQAGELYARVLKSYPQTEFVAEASRKLMETTRK